MPEIFTTAFEWIWTNMSTILTFITGSAILMLPFGFKIARKGVSAVKSLMGTSGRKGG